MTDQSKVRTWDFDNRNDAHWGESSVIDSLGVGTITFIIVALLEGRNR